MAVIQWLIPAWRHNSISILAAAGPKDELTAECSVLRNGKRAGISEITVTNQEGKMIAKTTGVTVRL